MTDADLRVEYDALLGAVKTGACRLDKFRDVSIMHLIGDIGLVIACDSNASNGEKPADTHPNVYEETAVNALKVPVMEVLATGAQPLLVVNNLCMEMEPSGRKIISVMRQELDRSGLQNVQLTGSTEDNMKTVQTGIGVTALGVALESAMKCGKTRAGDLVVCVGIPQSGVVERYSERDSDVAKIDTVVKLRAATFVHEILPIGSHGALYEANELAHCANLRFRLSGSCAIDVHTSAGSSTAVLVSVAPQNVEKLTGTVSEPVNVIGCMESPD